MAQRSVFLCIIALSMVLALASGAALPDGGDTPPLPGPGLSYGGIPYGSVSGNVAEFFTRKVTPSGQRSNFASYSSNGVDYSPIQQWL